MKARALTTVVIHIRISFLLYSSYTLFQYLNLMAEKLSTHAIEEVSRLRMFDQFDFKKFQQCISTSF